MSIATRKTVTRHPSVNERLGSILVRNMTPSCVDLVFFYWFQKAIASRASKERTCRWSNGGRMKLRELLRCSKWPRALKWGEIEVRVSVCRRAQSDMFALWVWWGCCNPYAISPSDQTSEIDFLKSMSRGKMVDHSVLTSSGTPTLGRANWGTMVKLARKCLLKAWRRRVWIGGFGRGCFKSALSSLLQIYGRHCSRPWFGLCLGTSTSNTPMPRVWKGGVNPKEHHSRPPNRYFLNWALEVCIWCGFRRQSYTFWNSEHSCAICANHSCDSRKERTDWRASICIHATLTIWMFLRTNSCESLRANEMNHVCESLCNCGSEPLRVQKSGLGGTLNDHYGRKLVLYTTWTF